MNNSKVFTRIIRMDTSDWSFIQSLLNTGEQHASVHEGAFAAFYLKFDDGITLEIKAINDSSPHIHALLYDNGFSYKEDGMQIKRKKIIGTYRFEYKEKVYSIKIMKVKSTNIPTRPIFY